jgi:hypothetical protein
LEADFAVDVLNLIRVCRKGHPDKDVIFDLRPEKRSVDQNALIWVALTHLAGCFNAWQPNHNYDKNDAHHWAVRKFLPTVEVTIGRDTWQRQTTTSELSKAEAAVFIDSVLDYCAERGRPLPLQKEYADWLEANR